MFLNKLLIYYNYHIIVGSIYCVKKVHFKGILKFC